mgnify:CR=1 FL=1
MPLVNISNEELELIKKFRQTHRIPPRKKPINLFSFNHPPFLDIFGQDDFSNIGDQRLFEINKPKVTIHD